MNSDLHDFILGLISNGDVFTTLGSPRETEFQKREDRSPYPPESSACKPRRLDFEELKRRKAAAEKEFWDSM
jgi:hypothetical protein